MNAPYKPDFFFTANYKGMAYPTYVAIRPGSRELIRTLASCYELVVFTASVKQHCDPIINRLDPQRLIQHRLYRRHCDRTETGGFVKDLSRLGRDLAHTLILDDRPESYSKQPRNGVPISAWQGDKTDQELLRATTLLHDIADGPSLLTELASKLKKKSPREPGGADLAG